MRKRRAPRLLVVRARQAARGYVCGSWMLCQCGGGEGRRTSGLRALHLVSVENFLAGFVPFAC